MSGPPPVSLTWILPGRDESDRHLKCGEFATWGHGSPDGWHWRRARRGCGAYECSADLSSHHSDDYRWRNAYTSRQARRIKLRLGKRAQHAVVSPPGPGGGPCAPPSTEEEYRRIRDLAYSLLKYVGVERGAIFPHPQRCVGADRTGGHDGFHFHVQTPCRIDPRAVRSANRKGVWRRTPKRKQWREVVPAGWVVKGLGFKPTLRVAIYELHHVGRMGVPAAPPNPASKSNLVFETEAVTWFGEWKTPLKIDKSGIQCPVCDEIVPVRGWSRLEWNDSGPPPRELSGTGGPCASPTVPGGFVDESCRLVLGSRSIRNRPDPGRRSEQHANENRRRRPSRWGRYPEILAVLTEVNSTRCRPSLSEAEVRKIAASVSRYALPGSPPTATRGPDGREPSARA